MRLGKYLVAALSCLLPAIAVAQTNSYLGRNYTPPDTVIRPAATTMWRNYVTVPDGPCGCPMSVEADCYNPTCRPCGPLHPVCFVKRVGRMLDCLVPCNVCCRGCCGLFHGCHLGGRTWGHCSMCCGGGACGGANGGACGACGGCGNCGGDNCGCGNCCTNPAGSVFASVPCCTFGGNCNACGVGCSDAVAPGMLMDPFQDDPLPPTPQPTSVPATEVRRVPANQLKPVRTTRDAVSAKPSAPVRQSSPAISSPYKIVKKDTTAAPQNTPVRRPATTITATEEIRTVPAKSVLRRASVESDANEPARHNINGARALPIVRSQSPYYSQSPSYFEKEVPANPLR